MSTTQKRPSDPLLDIHPNLLSRIGGALYLVIIVVGVSGEVIRTRFIVPGDATATAANISAMEWLWRMMVSAQLFYLTLAVGLALIFFALLRPVSRDLALLVVLFNLVSIAIEAVNSLHLFSALFPLGSAAYLAAFEPEQLHAMTRMSIRSYGYGFVISLLFFAYVCLILGYLIFRSGYLPKAIGVLLLVAGVSYLTHSFALFLVPDLGSRMFPAILLPAFVGEAALCLWLLIKGVDMEEWQLRTGARSAWSGQAHFGSV